MKRTWLLGVLIIGVAAFAPGCGCGGGGQGTACDTAADCDPGLFCDPATLTCEPLAIDSGTDAGPGVDSGFDATTGNDSGADSAVGTDSSMGTDSATCPDADMDGVTVCAGDCDDNDPNTYPGAPEVCGDNITNDCNSGAPPDMGCVSLGTYVAPPPVGTPGGDGTQAMPVDTIAAAMANSATIEMMGGPADTPVFVAAGTTGPGVYAVDILMVEGISILGGHESTGWTRDPAVNLTVIDLQSNNGIDFPSGITRATEISGFTINAAVGLGGGDTAAIFVNHNSEPIIENNIINAPIAGGNSHAILINGSFAGANPGVSPLITGNTITLGDGNATWGIRSDNTASEIIRNSITLSGNDVVERGINAFPGVAGLLISGNSCRGNPAGGFSDLAFCIEVGGSAIIEFNDVDPGMCFGQCVGIALDGAMNMEVTNNIAFGGVGSDSWGLRIAYEANAPAAPNLLIHSNFFHGGGAPTSGVVNTSAGAGFFLNPPNPVMVGRFYNNIMYSGSSTERYAFREFGTSLSPEAFENNALYVDVATPAFQSGLYYDDGATPLGMISAVNALPVHATNIADACMVVNPTLGGDFHLMPGSMCIDTGVTAELPAVDYEGDMRPMGAGPDIGVDETTP